MLQIYRLAVLVAIAWMIRHHHDRLRVQGDWPITVAEVKVFLPDAHRLKVDPGTRAGLFVTDEAGEIIGYTGRTMPYSRDVVGYSGPSDVLVVLDEEDLILGISIRHSYDTPSHIEDVQNDYIFMESWNEKDWASVAEITDWGDVGIWGVSGATRTSEAVMESITHRLAVAEGNEGAERKIDFHWRDAVLFVILLLGCLFAFWKKKAFQRFRWIYSVATIGVLGFWLGDLIAQSLLVGWMESRIPWEATPGLVLFVFALFLLPWFTKQPVYCQFICPHGNLQRWTMKWLPAKWVQKMPADGKWLGKWIPFLLLIVVLGVSFLQLDFDLAGIEPFDAYLVKAAGIATISIAVGSLLLSLFFPMVYCRFGCPTGWLLEFVRRRSGKDRFGARDWMGLGLFAVAVVLYLVPLSVWLG